MRLLAAIYASPAWLHTQRLSGIAVTGESRRPEHLLVSLAIPWRSLEHHKVHSPTPRKSLVGGNEMTMSQRCTEG
jgi:hypothetical protein